MLNLIKENFSRAIFALLFTLLTIATLSFLSFNTNWGLFLAGSFGATMVLIFGYPESSFAQPKNVFFGHLITSLVAILVQQFLPFDDYFKITIAVGFGIFFMILFGVTHPPAGGNPIVVILGTSSYEFLLKPIIFGTLIIIFYAIILNRFVLKKNYPINWPRK
jgi:CBS-domain-containing membrane protein